MLNENIYSLGALVFIMASVVAAPPEKKDMATSCPVIESAPIIKRKSIVLKDEHFGEGTMELYPGVMIIHLHGTPYEMGYQHGAFLKKQIKEVLRKKHSGRSPARRISERVQFMVRYSNDWPGWARDEIKGMAEGAGVGLPGLVRLNIATGPVKAVIPQTFSSTEIPSWLIAVYHPVGGRKFMAVSRPGQVGFMAAMDEQGVCVMEPDRASRQQSEAISFRDSFLKGTCKKKNDTQKERYRLKIAEGPEELELFLDPANGLICITHDQGATWAAVDLETESFHESCGLCGK